MTGQIQLPGHTFFFLTVYFQNQIYSCLHKPEMQQGHHKVQDILRLPISASRICQILGEASCEDEDESRASILIIDDLSFNCSILERTLKSYGQCLKASSGKEALSLFYTKSGIEMVVCDLLMPEMTGLEFYHFLQQRKHVDRNGQERKIPFVFVTACNDEELIEKTKLLAEENGETVYFFQKPANKDELVNIAKKALGLEEENLVSPYAHLFTQSLKL